MSMSDVHADSNTVLFLVRNDTTPYFTVSKTTRTSPECITGLIYKLLSSFHEGKPAAERMGRPPLRNTCNIIKVESAISKDRRHTVLEVAEITGRGKRCIGY